MVAVKDKSKANPYKSAYTIAGKLLLGMVLLRNKMNNTNVIILVQDNHKMLNVYCFVDGPRIPNLMPAEYLGRIGNRYRQGTRPSHPATANFDIEYEHIPEGFTAVDISFGERKHILLYTGAQIKLLSYLVLCIGSNLGLKFGHERPIRVLLPHLAEPKIYK